MALIRSVRFLVLYAVVSYLAAAQQPPRFVGTVQTVKADQGEIAIQTDQGDTRTARIVPETIFQRVAPGEKDLKQAQPIQLRDVAAGDRVLVALEPGTEDLRRLVVMPASDIAKRNEADRLDWQKRGVSGVVAARNGNEVTLKMRSLTGETQAMVTVGEKTSFRRYAPDSVKFADAKPSSLAEVGVGDQLRARGEKSEDGSKVTAQEVIFGTFLTKAGKISTVNPQTREIVILELNTNKPLLIRLTADSQMKQMPNFSAMGGMGGGMPGGAMPGGAMPGGAMPAGGMRPPDLSQMLERMPAAKLEDLQPGQTIVVSSTKGATKDELTAIMVLANADMLIRMASTQQQGSRGAQGTQGQMGAMGGAGMMGGLSSGGLEGMQLPGIMP
jgi:hypothetical protein